MQNRMPKYQKHSATDHNVKIFLSQTFYVKSILENLEVQKTTVFSIQEALNVTI